MQVLLQIKHVVTLEHTCLSWGSRAYKSLILSTIPPTTSKVTSSCSPGVDSSTPEEISFHPRLTEPVSEGPWPQLPPHFSRFCPMEPSFLCHLRSHTQHHCVIERLEDDDS